MNTYELTLLLPDEKEVEGIKKLVDSLKGKISEEQKWGKRDLSYPMDKHNEAFYYTWKVALEPKSLPELKKKLSFNEKLLRYLLLKIG